VLVFLEIVALELPHVNPQKGKGIQKMPLHLRPIL
jgi:hypothetical protein